ALARRVMRKGGDPNSGEALQAALTSEPTLPSVYGGSSTELGAMSWDTQTHQLDARPMSMLKITDPDGPPEIAATYGIGGKDLKVIKS
ncbi:MAG: hypothetical protein QOE60_902, partial [Thermoleophilaceae bacterium]|nr:hypothetical protein [Thermoleophilaceae bacterium]